MPTAAVKASDADPSRRIVYRTRGNRRGPITRLMSPGDLGEVLKPFIFLDLFEAETMKGPGFAPHPHSGIATLTTFLEGRMTYADSTGKRGELSSGAVEWMRAGQGVWHAGEPLGDGPMRGYQLWLSLPPDTEFAPPESLYFDAESIPTRDGIRVILGTYEGLSSPIQTPFSVTYLHVRLKPGSQWSYLPQADHDIAFLAVNSGRLRTVGLALERELVVFEDGADPIHLTAEGPVEMVIGSATKHPYDLVSGYYSVHTSPAALGKGERNISALGRSPAVIALHQRR